MNVSAACARFRWPSRTAVCPPGSLPASPANCAGVSSVLTPAPALPATPRMCVLAGSAGTLAPSGILAALGGGPWVPESASAPGPIAS